jgi:hypothetical protein
MKLILAEAVFHFINVLRKTVALPRQPRHSQYFASTLVLLGNQAEVSLNRAKGLMTHLGNITEIVRGRTIPYPPPQNLLGGSRARKDFRRGGGGKVEDLGTDFEVRIY